MKNPVLYKSLVIGVIVLFIGVGIQPAFADTQQAIENNIEDNYTNSEGKPDLIVTYIGPSWMDAPVVDGTDCTIKNRGDAPTEGSIDVCLIVYRMLFGVIPIRKYYDIESRDRVIEPGGRLFFEFSYIPEGMGLHLFYCKVNVYSRVDESNSDNNVRKVRYFILFPEDAILGWWGFG